ncbi:MAG: ABC transporter permease [Balneolaceae bacterium]
MNWRQVFLVMKREYFTRVKSKGFLAATLLVPVGIIAIYGIGILVVIWEADSPFHIGIVDETSQIVEQLETLNPDRYSDRSHLPQDSLRALVQTGEITGFIVVSEENITDNKPLELIYSGSGGLNLLTNVRGDMRDVFREVRLQRAEVAPEIQAIFNTRIALDSRRLTETGEEADDDTAALSMVGFAMGFVIFFAIFGYGGYIMRGVIEEKTNRIVEVIVSSVKPIELLTGKMAGVGALALTQIGIWLITIVGLGLLAGPILAAFLSGSGDELAAMESAAQSELPFPIAIPTIEISLVIYFVVLFILGYLLYSAMFAAVGAASDSETDTQQLMLPIMAPIFIAYFIMFQAVQNPDSTVSVVGSIIPFFTPIVMITRIAITDVPFWQVGLSMVLMLLTFVGIMLLSAKIYKIGILSYGSSAGFKDIMRWLKM